MKSSTVIVVIIVIFMFALSGNLLAKPAGKKSKKVPDVALNACVELAENDACSFTIKRGKEISGVCYVTPADDLACVPERMQKKIEKRIQRQTEALAACAGLALEDSCSVTSPKGEERFGSCDTNRNDDLVCRISRPDRPTVNSKGEDA